MITYRQVDDFSEHIHWSLHRSSTNPMWVDTPFDMIEALVKHCQRHYQLWKEWWRK